MSEKPKVIVIVGPTGVGKTSLSIEAAKLLGGEVISGDSMQIYRGLTIGTAKVTEAEKQGIPHHLLDERDPTESFSAADFKHAGRIAIAEVIKKGKVPIVAGGTGLYIESLLYELSLGRTESTNDKIRRELEQKADEKGKQQMWDELNHLDPVAARAIHPNNVRRVIRALEVIQTTGLLFSTQKSEAKESPYQFLLIGLTADRELLYQRIDQRVEEMMEAGLEQEAKVVWKTVPPDRQAAKGIGYKEFVPYFEGIRTLEEVVSLIQQHSRNYAKRQLTWFRNRFEKITWYNFIEYPEQKQEALLTMQTFLDKKTVVE